MKELILLFMFFILVMSVMSGCASTTVLEAELACRGGALSSYSEEDFNMKCQEHTIKEYRGLPQPQTQVIVIQPQPVQQPQVVYVPQQNPVVQVPQVQPVPEQTIQQTPATQPMPNGAGFGGRQIISRVRK